jgi:hypothetical protein
MNSGIQSHLAGFPLKLQPSLRVLYQLRTPLPVVGTSYSYVPMLIEWQKRLTGL